jgi:hypothetical protein
MSRRGRVSVAWGLSSTAQRTAFLGQTALAAVGQPGPREIRRMLSTTAGPPLRRTPVSSRTRPGAEYSGETTPSGVTSSAYGDKRGTGGRWFRFAALSSRAFTPSAPRLVSPHRSGCPDLRRQASPI